MRWTQIRAGRMPDGAEIFRASLVLLLHVAAACAGALTVRPAAAQTATDLRNLSIDQLADLEVTSVSRHAEPLSTAAASIYVITAEDIARSGATTLADALRLAPNLEVAQRTANVWAISARGFNTYEASNKLLVLIDGRSVYSPLLSGVFWDQQIVPLADIDRIEVISGPGGTLYGANAVNGVINVITKSSAATQGGAFDTVAGTQNQYGSVRWGGRLGDAGTYRGYVMGYGLGPTRAPDGASEHDDWLGGQVGFRSDFGPPGNGYTLQGDIYRNRYDGDAWASGENIIGRWTRQLDSGAEVQVQAYIDDEARALPGIADALLSSDISAQETLSLGDRQELVWGGGLHVTNDHYVSDNGVYLQPATRTLALGNLFAQDSIALASNLRLILGSKFEHSTYTGFEYLPNARLAWQIDKDDFLWSAISRAVRTPSRVDRELVSPGLLAAAPDFRSETLLSYEIGYRGRPSATSSFSVTLYDDVYDDLRTAQLSPGGVLPIMLTNGMAGQIYGLEAWGDWRILPTLKLSAGINIIHKDLRLKPGVVDVTDMQSAGNDPGYQLTSRVHIDLPYHMDLDFGVRWIDHMDTPPVPAYVEGDARLAWHATEALEFSLGGTNIFSPWHGESANAEALLQGIGRSIYLGMRGNF